MPWPFEIVEGVGEQTFPSVTITRQTNDRDEHEVTIRLAREAPLALTPEEQAVVNSVETLGANEPRPEPLVRTVPNREGGFAVYVTLVNESDSVTVGRPQSQGTRGGN